MTWVTLGLVLIGITQIDLGDLVMTKVDRQRSILGGGPLTELKVILTLVGRGEAPCRRVKESARNHLRDIEQRIRELQLLHRQLQVILQQKPRQSSAD